MTPRLPLDPAKMLKETGDRIQFLLNADKHMAEVVQLLKNTNEVLAGLSKIVDRLNGMVEEIEGRAGGMKQLLSRMDRLEEAALNIERATLGVEAAMTALPRALRTRITKARKPGVSDEPDKA